MIASEVAVRTPGAKKVGDAWRAPCPVHGSRGLTLSIADGKNGVVLHCFAGCAADQIVSALGLGMRDLFAETTPDYRSRPVSPPKPPATISEALERRESALARRGVPITRAMRNVARAAELRAYARGQGMTSLGADLLVFKHAREVAPITEGGAHGDDPNWPTFLEYALSRITSERGHDTPTVLDRVDAEGLAASWIRTGASS